jgi:hypothetical protein
MAAGKKHKISWEIPNIFNEGKIIVEPAVSDGGNMSIHQWWDNAAEFKVINEKKTPYIVAPDIKCSVK